MLPYLNGFFAIPVNDPSMNMVNFSCRLRQPPQPEAANHAEAVDARI